MRTLAQRLWQDFATAPERPAIHLLQAGQPDRTLTRRDLVRGAVGYTAALQQAGLQPGEVVILILQHGAPLVHAFWGAVLGGFVPAIMPFLTEKLSPEKYRRDLAALFEITRPAAVITYRAFEPEVHTAALNSSVRAVLVADEADPVAEPNPATLAGLSRSADDLVVLQHSSGTTGLQKGVALSHRAVLNQLDAYSQAIRLAEEDVIVSWLPLYHDMGLIAGFILPVLTRTPLVLMSPFDWVRAPHRLLHAVTRYRGTLSWLPNFAYNFCAQKIRDRDLEGVDLSSWRAVINCSEPMRWESHQAFARRFAPYGLRPEALATCYAMAENVFAVSQGGIGAPPTVDVIDARTFVSAQRAAPASDGLTALKMLSAGRPLANTRVRILDDQRRELPERHVGELALQGDCLLTGFYNRPDLTAQAFHDGWYLTGDLGYLADGEVYVSGRKKDLIIVGGKNVYPGDLEALAGEAPGVYPGRVVAFGVFDEQQGTEEVVIVAEAETDDEDERRRIADAIRERVTRGSDVAVRQVRVVGLRWLLKTSSGKIARGANREKFLAESGQAGGA